ncbi:MAG: hypothetical protein ACFE95_22980 [Candidatus Hodarchaeota archaeon]
MQLTHTNRFTRIQLGAAIAPLTASRLKEVKFVILFGGYGLIGSKKGTITRKYLGQALGETENESEEGVKFVKRIFEVIQSEEGWEEICSEIHEKMNSSFKKLPKDQQNTFQTADNYLKSTYEGFLLSEGNTPMYRSFLQYYPSSSLLKTSCPALLLFGELDVIHPGTQNLNKPRHYA